MKLLEEDDRRAGFLLRIAPDLRALFGREARLMLAESWNLSDPPHQELRLIVYTRLDRSVAEAARDDLVDRWVDEAEALGVRFNVTRLS